MKFGQGLSDLSVPEWRSRNIDYAHIKQLIKVLTTPGNGNALAIPGKGDSTNRKLEDGLFEFLKDDCNHVSLFVRSKLYEMDSRLSSIERKLDSGEKQHVRIAASNNLDKALRLRRKYLALQTEIFKVGQLIQNIARFCSINSEAIRKLLKKYKKWSKSTSLTPRVEKEILHQPSSFSTIDLQPATSRHGAAMARAMKPFADLSALGSQSPDVSGSEEQRLSNFSTLQGTPSNPASSNGISPSSRIPTKKKTEAAEERGWNEYDYPQSDDGDAFAVYVDPDAPWYPGQRGVEQLYQHLRGLLSPQKPITGADDARKASVDTSSTSSDDADDHVVLPPVARNPTFSQRRTPVSYGTLPLYNQDGRVVAYTEDLPSTPIVSTLCVIASFLLLLISTFLAITSRRKLQGEVDVAIAITVIAVICFATVGTIRYWTVERPMRAAFVDRDIFYSRRTLTERFMDICQRLADAFVILAYITTCIWSGVLLFTVFR